MSNPIHTCEFESGTCKLCGSFEKPRRDSKPYPVTYEQMDKLISEVREIDNTLMLIFGALAVIFITILIVS